MKAWLMCIGALVLVAGITCAEGVFENPYENDKPNVTQTIVISQDDYELLKQAKAEKAKPTQTANHWKMKTDVEVSSDGPVRGMWLKTDFGILAAVSKNRKIEIPYVCLYEKGKENKMPFAMRFDEDSGEVLLQIPNDDPAKLKIVKMSSVVDLVASADRFRHGGEYRSGDPRRVNE